MAVMIVGAAESIGCKELSSVVELKRVKSKLNDDVPPETNEIYKPRSRSLECPQQNSRDRLFMSMAAIFFWSW